MIPGHRLAVLAYHRVGPIPPGSWETWFSIADDIFDRQMDDLASSGWRVIGLEEAVGGLHDPATLPDRAVLITFDDGYRTLIDFPRRRLSALGYPAVVFVPTHWVGTDSRWNARTEEPVEALCTWEALRELQAAGFTVQSHGDSHTAFSRMDRDALRRELRMSKRVIEDELETEVLTLAYPFGDTGEDTSRILEEAGYQAAFIYDGEVASVPPNDRFMIERVAMGPETDLGALLN